MEASAALSLRPWVAARRVAWESGPAVEWVRGARDATAQEVMLFARVERGDAGPGCTRCEEAIQQLAELAQVALGEDPRDGVRFLPYYARWYYRRDGHGSPEVGLGIWLRTPLRAEAFERRLERLGVHEGGWPD